MHATSKTPKYHNNAWLGQDSFQMGNMNSAYHTQFQATPHEKDSPIRMQGEYSLAQNNNSVDVNFKTGTSIHSSYDMAQPNMTPRVTN
jgi:hypothetical protein